MERNINTITAGELIEILEDIDPHMPVVFTSNYGDYSRTQQIHLINGNIDETGVKESAYSDSGFAVADEDNVDDFDDSGTVFVIS